MSEISIIIISYNSAELTSACLQSISQLNYDLSMLHVVVVDNGSTESYQLPKKLSKAKWIDVVRSESNLGFTGGNNLGIEYSIERYRVEYIMLLNNDTLIESQALKRMLSCMEDNQQIGILSPKIYFAKNREYHHQSYAPSQKGKVIWYAGGSIDWSNLAAFHRGVDEVDRGQFKHESYSDFATGCCALIKREVVEKVGGLDDDYFLYFEDTDLSQQVKQIGYKVGYCDEAVVWHINAGSSDGVGSNTHLYFQNRNRLIFFNRYSDLKQKFALLRVLLSLITSSNHLERKAAQDFLLNRVGKQPVL